MGAQGLQFQTVPVVFDKGLDTKSQRKLVVPGQWLSLENVTLAVDESLKRRDGFSALVSAANGNGLATYNKELLALSGGYVYSASTTASSRKMMTGRRGYVGVSKSEIRRSINMQDTPDCATGGGYTCYVWREKNSGNTVTGVNVMLVDEATGTQLIPSTQMRANVAVFCPRVVYSGGFFFIFYMQGTSLYCRLIDITVPTTLQTETAIITSASLANLNFDAIPWFGLTPAAGLAYGWADGVTSVRGIVVSISLGAPVLSFGPTNLFTEAQLPVATLTGLAVCKYSTTALAGVFATSTGAAAMAGLAGTTVTSGLTVITGATQIDNAVSATASSVHVTACVNDVVTATEGIQICWDRESEWGTNALNPLKTAIVTTTLTALLPPATLLNSATFGAGVNARGPQGPFIAGKCFNVGGTVFLPVFVASVYNSLSSASSNPRTANTQNTYFLLEFLQDASLSNQWNVVAQALSGSYGVASINGVAPAVCTPCSVINPSSGVYAQVASELTQLVISGGINVSPTGLVRLSLAPNTTQSAIYAQLGETTYFAGGQLSAYDGAQVVEHGFPLFPEGVALTAGGAGTGSMTDGVHQVVAVYEWVDNAGQRNQSGPCLPVTATVNSGGANTGSIAVQVPTLLLSQKGGGPSIATDVRVAVYATTAGGLTFFRATTSGTGVGSVANSLAATTVSVTITSSDAILASNEVLYTQPNQAPSTLANITPGPCNSLCIAQNRLFFDRADQPFQFGYSQEYINNLGLQFSPDLVASVPATSGGITMLAAMDEKIIILCRNRPYVMYGTGPTPTGGFNNYSKPQEVPADMGCSEARSVLAMPNGIIFKSPKGFYLLQRDLTARYIGGGVAGFDSATVTSAVLMGDRQEARFTLSTGVTLVYCYEVDQWSTFTKAGSSYVIADAVWWPTTQRYTHISTSNGLNQDVPGSTADAPGVQSSVGVFITAQTSFLHLAALSGFQRARKLYLTATGPADPVTSTLSATVVFDDSDAADSSSYSFSISLSTAMGGATTRPVDIRHRLQRQKCKSVSFILTEGGTGTTPLAGIQALALEIGLKRGVNKLPAAQTVG